MYDLSFPDNPDAIVALFALELNPQTELLPFLSVKEVYEHFGAVTLDVKEDFF